MPIGLLLVGLRDREQAAFGERSADELQAGGETLLAETVGDREGGDSSRVAGSSNL